MVIFNNSKFSSAMNFRLYTSEQITLTIFEILYFLKVLSYKICKFKKVVKRFFLTKIFIVYFSIFVVRSFVKIGRMNNFSCPFIVRITDTNHSYVITKKKKKHI